MEEKQIWLTSWSKSEREKQISYIKAYVWNVEKNGTDEPVCRAATEMQTENDLKTQRGKEMVVQTESLSETNVLPYAK